MKVSIVYPMAFAKAGLINLHKYENEKSLYEAITAYAYDWYNNQRPHSYNGGIPPEKVA